MSARNKPVSYLCSRFPEATPSERIVAAWRRLQHDDALRTALDEPGRLLSGYFRERTRSPLGQIVAPANIVAAECDTLLIVGPTVAMCEARRLIDACSHPFHNLLRPGGRAGRARVLLLEASRDNDLLHAALDLVRRACDGPDLHDRWALAIVGPTDDADDEHAEAVRKCSDPLAAALLETVAGDDELVGRLFVQAAQPEAGAKLVADHLPYTPLPLLDPGLPTSGPALLAATAIGVDTVSLLKGSVWFWEAAKLKPAESNPVVALAEFLRRPGVAVAAWHHALLPLAEIAAVHNRERHEVVPAYRHEDLARLCKLPPDDVLHLYVEAPRRDRFSPDITARLAADYDKLAVQAEIRLTNLHDIGIGELYQWFAAAKMLEVIAVKDLTS